MTVKNYKISVKKSSFEVDGHRFAFRVGGKAKRPTREELDDFATYFSYLDSEESGHSEKLELFANGVKEGGTTFEQPLKLEIVTPHTMRKHYKKFDAGAFYDAEKNKIVFMNEKPLRKLVIIREEDSVRFFRFIKTV